MLKQVGFKRFIIIIIIIIIMALQSFVWAWPLFQFLDPLHSWWDSLDGGSARRKAATYTEGNTNTE
jgi:phosphatidylglycerophosphate synthase